MTENKDEIIIATHNASFHADDVFAVATILLQIGNDKNDGKIENDVSVKVIRTRHPDEIAGGDFVVDVGGIYSPEQNKFDHHQKGGAGKRENGIPYAAFGLVWKNIGPKVCADDIELWQKIDSELVCAIDANDNGYDVSKMLIDGVYSPSFSLSLMIEKPTWEERGGESIMYESFMRAVAKAEEFLKRYIVTQGAQLRAKREIINTYNSTENKSLVIFSKDYERINFIQTLSHLPEIIYFVYPDNSGTWSVEAVPAGEGSFEKRKAFPQNWAGLSDLDLEKATEVPEAIFCHNGRFLVKAKTEEGAIKLAKLALAL